MIKRRKEKGHQELKEKVEKEVIEDKDLIVHQKGDLKIYFAKQILWRQLIWQLMIVCFCITTYIKPSFIPSSVFSILHSDIILILSLIFTFGALYKGSINIQQKDNKQSGLELLVIIILQSLAFASITHKLQDTILTNFLIIQCMQLAIILTILIIFWNAIEINHLLYFRKMFWLSIILIGSEYFFTKNISINSMNGMIIYGSLMGFGTFTVRSLETILDGKFSLKIQQTNIATILVYTNLLLPSRKG